MSVSSLNSNGVNFGGLVSGIDPQKIIDGLTSIQTKRIARFTKQQTQLQQKVDTLNSLQTKLVDVQLNANKLARSAGGAFDGRKASSSDDTALTATAGSAAVPGVYNITVNSLARADQRASAGFADPNTRLKTGTLTIQTGTDEAKTITLDDRNNTLQGLADAINSAGSGVRAAVINDGSATPFRLLLTSQKTGVANAINLTNDLTGGTGAAIDPTATTIQAASDAQVAIGSGPGAITVSNSTNQISSLIPGVSFNLNKADTTKPITLTVTNDTSSATTAVKDFVTSFNSVIDFISERDQYDSEKKTTGVLQGNRDVVNFQNDLSNALSAAIPGLSRNANRLSNVGIAFDASGKLTLDETQLNRALSGTEGISQDDLKKLFGLTGSSDSTGVQFQIATSKTQPSGLNPYRVEVTSPATRGSALATNTLANSIIIDNTNNALLVKLNGITSSSITLDSGTFTQSSLVNLLQQKINTNSALNGNLASIELDGGKLRFSSQQFGTGSQVGFAGGSALATLGFLGGQTGTGTNVAGYFVVNGQNETATGSGQRLTGSSGNSNTDGLQVLSTLNAAGNANVNVSQGLAGRVNEVLAKYLDAGTGRFTESTAEIRKNINDIQSTIDKQNAKVTEQTDKLTLQFAQMETAISKLRNQGSQLASLSSVRTN